MGGNCMVRDMLCKMLACGCKSVVITEYNNKSALKDMADNSIAELLEDYSKLKELHYKLWHKSFKPFGFEIVDARCYTLHL